MRRLIALGFAFLFSCGSSGYIASEYSSRSVIAGKPTLKPVNAPLKTQATTQLGTSIGVNIVGGVLLGKWTAAKQQELLRKYYAICMIENGLKKESEDYCANAWANDKLMEVNSFLNRLRNGECTKKWFGISKGFRRCYKEAVDGVKDLHTDWQTEVWKILYYKELSDCIPDPADVKSNEKLLKEYEACRKKAKEYANEEYPKIMKNAGYEVAKGE